MKRGVLIFVTFLSLFTYTNVPITEVEAAAVTEYSDWQATSVTNCIISSDGSLFEQEFIKYEEQEGTGKCIKYKRSIIMVD